MIPPSKDRPGLIKELLIGYCLGTANIIPGVSGGTFLLIFKIYERVFNIVGRINKINIVRFLSIVFQNIKKPGKDSRNTLYQFLVEKDFLFLTKLLIGSAIAIVSLSSLMEYLILYQFEVTYALFFGLILISIIIPVKMLEHKKVGLIFFLLAGVVATVYTSAAVNPYDKIKMKSDLYQAQAKYQAQTSALPENPFSEQTTAFLSYTGKYTVNELIVVALSGAAAISAMILPGISGSLVLILMGQYFEVVSAISSLKALNLDAILFLGSFAVGMGFGGLLFTRLINIFLKKYYNATMAFLTGLMMGSLYALWPYKKFIIMPEQYFRQGGAVRMAQDVKVYTNINVMPSDMTLLCYTVLSFLAGCVIMSIFIRYEK